ncbi:hypothetical protein Tco_0430908 [Tanacetum coccineum]
MHNNIMLAGSRDRPPMLALGRYAQWQSRSMRYVDTRSNAEALKKCILQAVETFSNISPENKAHYDSENEAIHLLLTGIGYEIYLTIDAYKRAHDMWIAIERLQQCESLNKQDVKTNLFWELSRFTSRDGESIESYYSRFVTIVKQTVDLDKESYHKLFDILKQYQKEVNDIRAEKIAKNANPLALVADAQQYPETYYQAPKPHKSYAPPSIQSSSTRSHATTRHKGKEIAKPITPLSESASEEDSDPEQAQRDKDMQKNLAFIAKYFKKIYKPTSNNLKTSLNSKNKNVDTTPRYQDDWLEDTDEEIYEQELEAHYSFMEKIQEVLLAESGSDAEPLEKVQYDVEYNVFANKRQHSEQHESINEIHVVEKDDSNGIHDSSNMCDNDNQVDKNVEECDNERVVLANLITNLKLDNDENKKIQKQLKKANTSLSHVLQECKSALEECKSSLEKSNRTQDRYLGALHDKEVELEKYKIFKDHTIEKDTLEHKLNETLGLLAQKEHDIQEGLKIKAYEVFVVKEKNDELVK